MKRRQINAVILLFSIAIMYFAFQKFQEFIQDPDTGSRDTRGLLLATEILDEGAHAMLIKEDGTTEPCPNYKAPSTDKVPVWRPDGQRAFFLSDRQEGAFLIHRWNVAKDSSEARSAGTRSVTNIYWGPFGETKNEEALVTVGGFVLSYNPRLGTTTQILPPVAKVRGTNDEGGNTDQFQVLYQRLGSSFKEAKWAGNHDEIAAVMNTEDGREVMIIQSLIPKKDPMGNMSLTPPQVITAAKRIDFDIDIKGRVAVAILGFDVVDKENPPPELVKNGKFVKPYENGIVMFDPSQDPATLQPIVLSNVAELGFDRPKISPDGSSVIALVGKWSNDSQFATEALIGMPFAAGGGSQAAPIYKGNVVEAVWHPGGRKVAIVQRDGRTSNIYTMDADGQNIKQLTNGKSFGSISYSPQVVAPK